MDEARSTCLRWHPLVTHLETDEEVPGGSKVHHSEHITTEELPTSSLTRKNNAPEFFQFLREIPKILVGELPNYFLSVSVDHFHDHFARLVVDLEADAHIHL